jgi:ribonuclease VapC
VVIDSSALTAILLAEPEAEALSQAMASDPRRLISTLNLLETGIVIEARKGEPGGRELDLLLHRVRADVVPFTESQAEVARAAWRRWGKGRHPAGLTIGDCAAYALAKTTGEPLLCKGEDFPKTDAALWDWRSDQRR